VRVHNLRKRAPLIVANDMRVEANKMRWSCFAHRAGFQATPAVNRQAITRKDIDMQEERNKKAIREFTRIFKNEHNVDGVDHLFDTKKFVHHFRSPLSAGFEGMKQVGRMMNGAFPDVVVTEDDLIASGDRVVERSAAVATHRGSMTGEKPTNQRIAWSEIHIYRLQDGKIVEHWAEIAMMELLQQVGVLPLLG